jgi:hypothetical protein
MKDKLTKEQIRSQIQAKWDSLGFLDGLNGHIKPEIASLYECCKTAKIERFAVYEKEPRHGKDKDGVILEPFNTKEEAEQARVKYGYGDDNYYVEKMK